MLNALVTPSSRPLLLSALVSAALLAGAHLFEKVGGLDPCLLCLSQREVHWAALFVSLIALGMTRLVLDPRLLLVGLGLLTLVYLYSTYMGAFHAGVEWDFWDGPAGCAAGGGALTTEVSADDILGSLNGPGLDGPPCEIAAWRMLGISMAGYNALISAGMAALCGWATWRQWQRRPTSVASEKLSV
ncbi:disulfide bond formation protein B [Parvularcula sp. LCG005]|uniref:disulfide bond formation protein B n=1 Tax=Parvularcula sp. LCG005 TaxID=3078805 RepID=UPI0029425C8C|nr:disulfide bond formation protein B [Parvularcula sp. LCG005]WOI54442.1 disulfide bond formation protein B [Parvularcula sp. LCG005]